jgi:penicillin-binding protein 2
MISTSRFLRAAVLAALVHPFASSAAPEEDTVNIQPSWETQKSARTYLLNIPAPRGQIVDRNGVALAQNRVGYSLCLSFPTPPENSDAQVLAYARERISAAERLLSRKIKYSEESLLKHYRNRGLLPFELVEDLLPAELAAAQRGLPPGLVLRPLYLRFYPNGGMAGHVLGYCGRTGRALETPVQNSDPLWPDFEGREGLEKAFNQQLTGRPGQMNISYDPVRNRLTENITIPPQPGHNVITTIDEEIQRTAEKLLSDRAERGAIVVIEPQTGDILAMASWPTFNPNVFVPSISATDFNALQNDPDIPLLPRAFRSAYPPGSVFKIFVGLAALESRTITEESYFECPPSYSIGRLTFRNWKKEHAGSLNFVEALTQSCNTWFYQVAIKTGGEPIIHWSRKLGLGEKTGIPLEAETAGRIPTNDYMRRVYKRPLMDGDLANMGIGQGDLLISPLQMAQAMAALGNGGILYQTRLVRQIQSLDGKVTTAYEVRAKDRIFFSDGVAEAIKEGMKGVVQGGSGTAASARVKGIQVAGKTGTAQWGPKNKERTAAWFAGFAPAENPRYAFAAVYEGAPNDDDVHGGSHAAPLIGKLLQQVFDREAEKEKQAAAAQKSDA